MQFHTKMMMLALNVAAAMTLSACSGSAASKVAAAATGQSSPLAESDGAPDKSDYVLFVTVKVKPESIGDFKAALLSIVEPTRSQDGNLAYFVHQSPSDASEFAVYEHWESDAAHIAHIASPVFANYSKLTAPMLEPGYPVKAKYIELDQ